MTASNRLVTRAVLGSLPPALRLPLAREATVEVGVGREDSGGGRAPRTVSTRCPSRGGARHSEPASPASTPSDLLRYIDDDVDDDDRAKLFDVIIA